MLDFPISDPFIAGVEGRPSVVRGADPLNVLNAPVEQEQTPEKKSGGIIPDLNPFNDGRIEKLIHNVLISFAGLLILAVGLLALVLGTKGGGNG